VERSILVEGGGCPWTDSTCLPCTTLIVRCIVIILYSLIIIYMDRYSPCTTLIVRCIVIILYSLIIIYMDRYSLIMSKYSVIIIYFPYVVWYRLIVSDIKRFICTI
jgi:hypothetical protein